MARTNSFQTDMPAPVAPRRPQTRRCGAHTIEDAYAWLRAENWREVLRDPKALPSAIRSHLLAENAYCQAALADTVPLQRTLVAEMRARLRENDSSVPAEDGRYAYFDIEREGCEHPLHARRAVLADGSLDEETHIVLDANALAAGHDYFRLGALAHSPNDRYLAYAVDTQGSEFFEIRFRDMQTGADLPECIHSATEDLQWAADSRTLYWVWRDDENRPREVRRHVVGAKTQDPAPLYREEDDGFFLGLGQTSDRRFILIEAHNHSTSEVRCLDSHATSAAPMLIAPRQEGVEYHADHAGTNFYILTNADGAEDFKIVTAPETAPQRANWRDLVGAKPGVLRLQQRLFENFHVRLERENAVPRLVIRDLRDGSEHSLKGEGAVYDLTLEPLYDFATTRMRYATSSLAAPEQIFDYDMASRTAVLRKRADVPSGHDPDAYITRRLYATAPDGAQVPVSLVHRKDVRLDGTAPLLLYGYGSYGITVEASFSAKRLSLLERGFVYAIAHVRGGQARGHAWYTAAKGKGKPKTFDDYIAVARMLIAQRYSRAGRIIVMGRSAGGLLAGAVMNRAPELFGGVIAGVPFVDVLNTMCDDSLPLTPPEWPEWGNPREDEEAFDCIRRYSPYDNVREAPYPPLLATAGLADPRVTYWEPAKWVARLRHCAPQGGPYLLHTEMQAGHGGANGRYEELKPLAMEYAFAIKAAGLALK